MLTYLHIDIVTCGEIWAFRSHFMNIRKCKIDVSRD